jgi:hypothetical protein
VDIGLISWPRCSSAQQWSSPRAPPLLTPWPPLPFSGARSAAYLPLRPCSGLRAELLQLAPMAAPSSSPLRACSPYVLISGVCPELCAPRNYLARLSLTAASAAAPWLDAAQFVYCSPVRATRHTCPLSVVESLRAHQLPVSRSIRLNRSSPAVHACWCAAALVRISPKSLPWLSGVWPALIRVRSYRHRRVVAGDSFARASNSCVESFSGSLRALSARSALIPISLSTSPRLSSSVVLVAVRYCTY